MTDSYIYKLCTFVTFSFFVAMQFQIINVNFAGQMRQHLDLPTVQSIIKESSRLINHPAQLVIKKTKNDDGCVIFFKSGKFRVMGLQTDCKLTAFSLAYKYTSQINVDDIPTIRLQSMCVKTKFDHHINLERLYTVYCEQFSDNAATLELELFPALCIRRWKPISINIFASGAIVMFGIKDLSICTVIIEELYPLFCKCAIII